LNLVLDLLAQAAGPTTAPGDPARGAASGAVPVPPVADVPLLLAIAVLYIFMFRSKGNEKKQREQMLSTLKRGDRVQTIGGILGTVIEAAKATCC
jgi:preprotein translocase YajC subunit